MKINLSRENDNLETISYRSRLWEFLFPGPFVVGGIGLILWLTGIRPYGFGMMLFAAVQFGMLAYLYLAKRNDYMVAAFVLYFYLFFSFIATLVFGGILNSGGVALVGLAGTLHAISFLKPKHFKILFGLFLISIIAEAILEQFLTPYYLLPEKWNLILFVMHLMVIAGVIFETVSSFIAQSLKLKEEETKKLIEIDQFKTEFYTNITHEFRTPLTVMIGLANKLGSEGNGNIKHDLNLITQNCQKLLTLINQMLDLSKISSGVISLNLQNNNLISQIKRWIEPYDNMAMQHNIGLIFQSSIDALNMSYDPEKVENVLGNLLSNAIKNSPRNTSITCQLDVISHPSSIKNHVEIVSPNNGYKSLESYIRISVIDEGKGIPGDQILKIFDRYYRIESSKNQGTGIGLAIVKELISLMGGGLYVLSHEGAGSDFTILLPLIDRVVATETNASTSITEEVSGLESTLLYNSRNDSGRPKLLLIEDNRDVAYYIQSLLKDSYQLEMAYDGKEGIEKADLSLPDIVITDIMMPEMDGYEVCDYLKSNFLTSHIPIVMLTAKSDLDSKVEGYKSGADAYLSKPFEPKELIVILANLLKQRESLKSKYWIFATSNDQNISPRSHEEEFLQKLKMVLNDHLDDEHLDTEKLASLMFTSRTQLFRKLKSLTGQPASNVIRSFRLNKAKEFLERTDYPILQIALEVGFKDQATFSRSFKNEFGINPTSYKRKSKNDLPS